jgi:hypothetical protein
MSPEARQAPRGAIKPCFKIYEWTGRDLTHWHGDFEAFEEAWAYILGDMTDTYGLTEEDYQEYYVEEYIC